MSAAGWIGILAGIGSGVTFWLGWYMRGRFEAVRIEAGIDIPSLIGDPLTWPLVVLAIQEQRDAIPVSIAAYDHLKELEYAHDYPNGGPTWPGIRNLR